MSLTEKIELEGLLEQRLQAFHAAHGGGKFLDPGWAITLTAEHGPRISHDPPATGELARIEFHALLSIRSLLAMEHPELTVTRNMLPNLATEATHQLALQINQIAAAFTSSPASDTDATFAVPPSTQTRRGE